MARFEFKLPDIGEGVAEGEVVSWLVKVGDQVAEDQEMVEVMTDKATVTIGAPKAGKVAELRAKEGDAVPVGKVLLVLELGDGAGEVIAPPVLQAAEPEPARGESAATAVGDIRESLPGMSSVRQPEPAAVAPVGKASSGNGHAYFNEKPLAAPATRKLARELGVDLRQVVPSGEAERVTRADVESYRQKQGSSAQSRSSAAESRPSELGRAPAAPQPGPPPRAPAPLPAAMAADQRVPIRGLRKRIFENMARSKHTAAHFTYVDECDVSALRELRERTRPHAERAGVKLTFLPFIVKAVVAALRKHPALNCLVDDAAGEMILRGSQDIGIATATEAGLMVPVVRRAGERSVIDIAREIERLAAAARDGKIQKEDLGASTFTITSLGKDGGLFATPVVNYPEVAILGVHEMKKKPVVKGDQIVIGEVMLLSLSFDHRIIDGHIGAAFAKSVIGFLEEPMSLLVEMR